MNPPSRELLNSEPADPDSGLSPVPPGNLVEDDPIGHIFLFIRKRGLIVLFTFIIGLALAVSIILLQTKAYTASAKIEVKQDTSQQFRLEQVPGIAGDDDDSEKIDTEIEILGSRTLAMETITVLHLQENRDFYEFIDGHPWDISKPAIRNKLISKFLNNIAISRLGHTNIISIHVTSTSPYLAEMIANTLIDNYIEHSFRDKYAATSKISSWLDTQLSGLKDNLQKSQMQMLAMQKNSGIFVVDQSQNQSQGVMLSNLEELNKQLASAQVDHLVKEARLRAMLSSSPDVIDALAGSFDPALQASKANLVQLKSEYASVIQTYGPAFPRVKELKAQIDQLERNLSVEENAQISRAQKELDAAQNNESMLRTLFEDQKKVAFNNGTNMIQFELARREYETDRTLYDGLQERLQEAGIMAGLQSTSIHIVDSADMPVVPSSPRVNLDLALGCGMGAIFGLALAFFIETLDTNLKTMAEIEQALQLPLLAAIPAVAHEELNTLQYIEATLSKGGSSWSKIAETIRSLRTSILLSSPGTPPKVLMITSTRPGEGKSSISALIAITCALNGSRVLLIDADLRKPSIHILFRINKQSGLSAVLSGKQILSDAIIKWPPLPNLHILVSGPVAPLPSELLGSKVMANLIAGLRQDYDFIFVDTPPVFAVTDAALLSSLADATVLILRYGEAQRHVAQRSVELLRRSGAKFLGVVINAVNFRSPEYAEYYGNKYYDYYGEGKNE